MPLIILTKTDSPSRKQRMLEFKEAFEGILFFCSQTIQKQFFYVKYDASNNQFKIMETSENSDFLKHLRKHFQSFCIEFLDGVRFDYISNSEIIKTA